MTALAQDFVQPLTENCDQYEALTLYANATIYAGTLAMNDAGVIKPFTSAGYVAGATLMGFPTARITETTGSNVTYTANRTPLKFRRNCPMIVNASSIAQSYVGKTLYLKDNFTASTSDAGSEFPVTCLAVLSATQVLIKLP